MTDLCRTGCGKTDCGCGPVRIDPFTGDWPDDPEVTALKKTVRELSQALRDVRLELLLHDTDAMGRVRGWVYALRRVIDKALGDA